MDYFNVLMSVHIKYDFSTESDERKLQKEWTECRLNVQSAENSNRRIQAFCYPTNYSELLPYFMISIDYASIRLGRVSSRSENHTYGLFWDCGSKQCRILLAFKDKDSKKRYVKYLKNLLALFRSQHEFENKSIEREQVSDDKLFENPEEILESNDEPATEVFRVSDASGKFQDVVLRPKSQRGRRLPRPLAVFSNLFKLQRSNNNNSEKSRPHSLYRERIDQIISIFKKKPSVEPDAPSFQHFQQPLNEERCSDVMLGSIANMEWYDLNQAEMNAIEGRVTEILNRLNGDTKMGEADIESMCNLDFLRRLTISQNILWSHSLSQSRSGVNNMSEVNLIGANMYEDQIRRDVLVEGKTLTTSMESLDSNGHTVMKPERSIVIDDITKEMDFSCERENRLSFTFDENALETPFPPPSFQELPCLRIPSPTLPDVTNDIHSSESVELTPTKSATKRSFPSKKRPSTLFGLLINNSPAKLDKSVTSSGNASPTTPEKKKYRTTPFKRHLANRLSFADNRKCQEKNANRSEKMFEKVFVQNIIESPESQKLTNVSSKQQFTPTKWHQNSSTDASNTSSPASGKFNRNPSIVKRIKQVFTVKKTMYI